MIIKEIRAIGEKEFEYTYSDLSLYIQQTSTGNIYDVAYDLLSSNVEYIETDKLISDEEFDIDE